MVLIADTLQGVGDDTRRHIEYGDWAIHYRRPTSEAERTALSPAKEEGR